MAYWSLLCIEGLLSNLHWLSYGDAKNSVLSSSESPGCAKCNGILCPRFENTKQREEEANGKVQTG